MTQMQGDRTSAGGRLDGSNASPVAAANFVLGAGWGNTPATIVVAAGSTDQRGSVLITSKGTGQAQATATVILTFADGAYEKTPFAIVMLTDNSNAITTAQPQGQVISTTALQWAASVLPVDTKTYTFTYLVIA